jgi:drug/metabolite transporter (DMT)-like permease
MWLTLTALAVLSRALYGVLTKVLSNFVKVGFITQTALLMVAGTIWGLLLSPFVGGINLAGIGSVWLILAIAIITSALGNVLYFKGISTLESGTTQIAFSSILIWSVIMAWVFLGTRFSLVQALGVLLLLFAILLAQYQKGSLKAKPGIWLIVASAACFAGFQISSAQLSHTMTPGTYLVLTYLGDAILIGLPYLKSIKRDLKAKGAKLGGLFFTVAVTGALSILFNVFAYYAYKTAPDAGIVVLLLTTQVVLAVILSIVFLKERSNIGLKLTAGVLAVIAALMIKA